MHLAERVLKIDRNGSATTLVGVDGDPIWPVRSDDEEQALRRFAEKFGITVQCVRGRPGSTATTSEVVAGFGPGVEESARLYAHLTGRTLALTSSLETLVSLGPSVVVTTLSRVRNDLLSMLYSATRNRPMPGLICADSDIGLRQQVLVRAAAGCMLGPDGPGICVSSMEANDSTDPEWVTIGVGMRSEELLERLGSGVGVVGVVAHSDGVDASLGVDLILCPMDRTAILPDPRRGNRCAETGMCHRLKVPVTTAVASPTVVAPEVLSAWCLIWAACWGVMPPDGVVDQAAGLAPRFLANPTLGAILTTWNIAPISHAVVERLARSLFAAMNVSEALAALLESRIAYETGLQMCLFGDPRVSVRAPVKTQLQTITVSPPTRSSENLQTQDVEDPLVHVSFLRALLRQDSREIPSDLFQLLAEALAAIERYTAALQAGWPTEEGPASAGPTMRRMVLDYLKHRGPRILHSWVPLARVAAQHAQPLEQCFACCRAHNTLTILVCTINGGGGIRRRLSFCPCCGVVEDACVESDARLSLGPAQVVRLSYSRVFKRQWAGVLVVKPQLSSERISWDWPSGCDGLPVREFVCVPPWPVGPVDVGGMFLSEAQLIVVSQRGRGRVAS